MARIRVAYVIGSLDVGGTERQLVELAARLDRGSFEARICCLSHPGALAEPARARGVDVEALGVGAHPLWKWARWTRTLRRRSFRGADVVHAFLFPSYALAACAAFGVGTPVVAGIRATYVEREGQWPFSLLDRFGVGQARAIVVNAEAVRSALVARRPAAAAKTVVIPNGVDVAPAPDASQRDGVRRELGLASTDFGVLMLANLIPYKGHQDALQALAALAQRLPDAVLVLAGAGSHEDALRALAVRLGLGPDRVRFLGRRDDVPRLLQACDVLLLASHHEGLPNALMEAMAAGRPVVATRVGGVPELVSHGVTGLLVEPARPEGIERALLELATDPALRDRLAAAGRAAVAKFAWSETVAAHQRLYASLVEAGAQPPSAID